jgi:hypothetical protein
MAALITLTEVLMFILGCRINAEQARYDTYHAIAAQRALKPAQRKLVCKWNYDAAQKRLACTWSRVAAY